MADYSGVAETAQAALGYGTKRVGDSYVPTRLLFRSDSGRTEVSLSNGFVSIHQLGSDRLGIGEAAALREVLDIYLEGRSA